MNDFVITHQNMPFQQFETDRVRNDLHKVMESAEKPRDELNESHKALRYVSLFNFLVISWDL